MLHLQCCWQFFITISLVSSQVPEDIFSENMQPQPFGPKQKLKCVFATPLPKPSDDWKLWEKLQDFLLLSTTKRRKIPPLWLFSMDARSGLNCSHLLFVFYSPLQFDSKEKTWYPIHLSQGKNQSLTWLTEDMNLRVAAFSLWSEIERGADKGQ